MFNECKSNFPNEKVPVLINKSGIYDLCFDSFAVLYSGETKTPVFAIEKLSRDRIRAAKTIKRTNQFYEEGRLPQRVRSALNDYHNSGYDRGHMAPAGDMPNDYAMAQSFSLANVIPQSPENNRGVWALRVESPTRKYAQRAKGDIFVYTGPIFTKPIKKIGKNNVWVPSHLFKLIYDPDTHRAWAYWIENSPLAKASPPISYREFLNRTQLDLLSGLVVIDKEHSMFNAGEMPN